MIDRESLQEAISICLREQNPTAHTCIKLAAYIIILKYLEKEPPKEESSKGQADNESAQGERSISDIIPVYEEMMNDLQIVNPKLYDKYIRRLKGRG